MLSPNYYKSKCSHLGIKKPIKYSDYIKYEKLWIKYLAKIVMPVIRNKKPACVRLILCESGPKTVQHPYPNYIFNLSYKQVPPYLDQIWKGIHQNNLNQATIKFQALVDLANHVEGPVIIIDLLPSHGISMAKNRKQADKNPHKTVDIDKIHYLINKIKQICPKIEVLAVFATPPDTTKSLNVPYAIDPSFKWFLPTINAGQGQKPSWKTLSNYVDNGFKCV